MAVSHRTALRPEPGVDQKCVSLFSWATRSEVRLLKTRTDWLSAKCCGTQQEGQPELSVVGHREKGYLGYLKLTLQHKTVKSGRKNTDY